MRVLITSSRFPHALDAVRKLGEQGHEVYAADTFDGAPGSHSRHVTERRITASPAFEPERFIDDVEEIVRTRKIDLVLPCFEEAFCIARHGERLRELTHVFCPPYETLAKLHDKRAFVQLTEELGLPVPVTRVAESREQLRAATEELEEYIARAAFSRGGVTLLTNTGPLAGRVSIDECSPSPRDPWIVQEFVRGTDVCSFSVAQHGKIVAHCAYEHPKTIEHAGGILFESIDEPETLRLASAYVEALGYHGTISFDYLRTDRGLVMVECNPRPTAGIFMMRGEDFAGALFAPPDAPRVVEPGVQRQIAIAILRDMFRNWREIPNDLDLLFNGPEDVYATPTDTRPAIYALLSYTRVLAFRKWAGQTSAKASDIMAAQFFDVAWNGEQPSEAAEPASGEHSLEEETARAA